MFSLLKFTVKKQCKKLKLHYFIKKNYIIYQTFLPTIFNNSHCTLLTVKILHLNKKNIYILKHMLEYMTGAFKCYQFR